MSNQNIDLRLPDLAAEGKSIAPRGPIAKWFLHGAHTDEVTHQHDYPWYKVLWLTGVDYFSTLGYQPGIALLAAGALSPIATIILLIMTLFGALPVYRQVAERSFAGQGSIAMLENLLPGWNGKVLVLILIGFATTDFVITMTLSAADAAQHAIENPFLHHYLEGMQIPLTLLFLTLLAAVFLVGFSEAINVATFITIPYLLLNLVVIGRGVLEVIHHPIVFPDWKMEVFKHGDTTSVLLLATLIFPRLALGMSGFETGVTVMPLISNKKKAELIPEHRIVSTKKLLLSAAVIMSVMLVSSSFITTLLIPKADYQLGGPASGRALAYLAHKYLGHSFGTVYDVSTITILWFAGASAMAGMLSLIPRYLPRFGMAPFWVAFTRPLVLVLFVINILVTLVFKANVEAQGGAYATGVLVLMLSAAVAVALALWREPKRKSVSVYFWFVALVFVFTLIDNVISRPDGVIIAGVFTILILLFSGLSRYVRAKELRVARMTFLDEESKRIWPEIVGKKINLVPMEHVEEVARKQKLKEIQQYYNISGPVAFAHVNLIDNRSEFLTSLQLEVRREGECYLLNVYGAIAVANSLAYLSELIDPKTLFLGLTRKNLISQAVRYLLLGEGEIGLSVYAILLNHWAWTPEDDVRPLIFLMSE